MKQVLFVCYGNIMRSQMAEAFYNHLTKSTAATSAGTDGFSTSYHTKPDDGVIAVMQEEGIDISDKHVKHITEDMVDRADEVYVLSSRGDCPAYLADSPKAVFWNVPDPWGNSLDTIRRTRDNIKERVEKILS